MPPSRRLGPRRNGPPHSWCVTRMGRRLLTSFSRMRISRRGDPQPNCQQGRRPKDCSEHRQAAGTVAKALARALGMSAPNVLMRADLYLLRYRPLPSLGSPLAGAKIWPKGATPICLRYRCSHLPCEDILLLQSDCCCFQTSRHHLAGGRLIHADKKLHSRWAGSKA